MSEKIEIKNRPLEEYLTMIKNSFNGNNRVFEVRSFVYLDDEVQSKTRYVSQMGFCSEQAKREGYILEGIKPTNRVEGIDQYLTGLKNILLETCLTGVVTEMYDKINSPLTIIFNPHGEHGDQK